LKRLSYVPAYTVRPLENRGELVDVIEDDSITPLSENREIVVKRRFDIFVQIVGGRKVYYRSPGDPRIISRTTGKAYKSEDEMRKSTEDGGEGKNAQAANDLLWIAQHSPMTPCPPPRWIGNLLQVLGGREADETNWYYLHDSAIPYGLLFVSGGTIPTDIRSRLENRIATEVRGSEGSGKILVVQAKPMGKTGADGKQVLPEMTFQSLRDAVDNDALFLKYDERGADRIGASFRLPPILRGYTPQTLNRATAFAAIYLAEQQVFQPEREDGDWLYNKYILPEIGVKLYRFVSNSPPTRDVEDVANIIKAAAPHGGLLPQEIRAMLSDLLNRPFAKIQEDWAQQPMVMTLAGLGDAGIGNGSLGDEENMGIVNQRLAQAEQRIAQIVQEELATLGTNVDVRAAFMDRAGNGENE
jgi:capsid portal protein